MDRTAGMTKYEVTIEFTDGVFTQQAFAYDESGAANLVQQDARMASSAHPCFYGKVISTTVRELAAA